MSSHLDWARSYARQADADFKAWELYAQYPVAVAAECHRLQFLQMACEKLCKAYLIRIGTPPGALRISHGYVAKPLPGIIRLQISDLNLRLNGMRGIQTHIHHMANEIELLSPAMDRNGQRPDNCEYPWEDGAGTVHSPLDWSFYLSDLCTAPAGRTFLKLVRTAIDELL